MKLFFHLTEPMISEGSVGDHLLSSFYVVVCIIFRVELNHFMITGSTNLICVNIQWWNTPWQLVPPTQVCDDCVEAFILPGRVSHHLLEVRAQAEDGGQVQGVGVTTG